MSIFDSADEKTQEKLKNILVQCKKNEKSQKLKPKFERQRGKRENYETREAGGKKGSVQTYWETNIPNFVAVDIETTGLNKNNDRIIEIGAVKFVDGKLCEEFSTLINPGIGIPEKITQLTGIDNESVKNSPKFEDIMSKFIEFIGRLSICGHNVDFDISFLNAEIKRLGGLEITNWKIDTLILSRIIFELEEGYSLSKVANHLNISLENAHRALDDAKASGLIAVSLIPQIKDIPILSRVRIANNSHGFTKRIFDRTFGNSIPKPKYEIIPEIKPLESNGSKFEITAEEINKYYREKLLPIIENYEIRQEQIEFAQIISKSLNKKQICAIETGTGTGKTIGYLIPAILTAFAKNERIIISTNTKQLQNQLVKKDLPILAKLFTRKIAVAVLKGKNNYICRKAFENVISGDVPGISPRDKNSLLPLIIWYEKTKNGDIDEQNSFNRQTNKQLWDMISAQNKQCKNCEFFNRCFLTKARRYALASNIAVVNHAFFYSDVVAGNEIIENSAAIFFDEAHHLEETGFYSLKTEIDTNSLNAAIETFQHIHTVLHNITKEIPPEEVEINQEFIDEVIKLRHTIHNLRKAGEIFLKEISEYLVKNAGTGENPSPQSSILTLGYRDSPFAGFEGLQGLLFNNSEFLDISRLIKQKHCEKINSESILAEIASTEKTVQQINADIKYLCEANTAGDIFWLEGPANKKWIKLTGTTTNIKNFLNPFWKRYAKPVIFTSATLSPQKNIEYFAERIGISDLEPTLKQFENNAVNVNLFFAATTQTPEITSSEFNRYTAETIKKLSERYRKNIMALFTNNDNLEQVFYELTGHGKNATVFAQGLSGNNAWIQRQMKEIRGAVLLGSGSFWEGVDMPGNECEILIIPKLPFPVPTHPLQKQLAANAESDGKNGFMDYSLPETLLKFRQGVGRLIRNKNDKGALFVLDSRIILKNYGKHFINLINTEVYKYSQIDQIYDELDKFFGECQ